jgi:hypothetical protein
MTRLAARGTDRRPANGPLAPSAAAAEAAAAEAAAATEPQATGAPARMQGMPT